MKKFLQKSSAWLVMLVAWFAVSMSAMAQESVTFDLSKGTQTVKGVTVTSPNYDGTKGVELWGGTSSDSYTLTIASPETPIAKVEFTGIVKYGNGYNINMDASVGSFDGATTGSSITWVSTEGANSVKFIARKTGVYNDDNNVDFYVKTAVVYFAAIDPVTYTVNFEGEIPAGCSAGYGEDSFTTSGGTFTVAKNLQKSDLVVTTTDDYYAEVDYNEGSHTYTVAFNHWITYNVTVTGHPMGALEYNGYYGDGNSFQSKSVVEESAFSAYDLNGYDEAVSVTQESEYVYNVTVTYTESAAITYTVTFNILPEGAYAWINGQKYEANGTFQSNLELSNTNIEQVYCPEGYYDNSYYSASDHTFYINYIEYDKFYVVVEGTEDPEAGVKYDYQTYHNGDILYTSNTYYLTNYFDYYVTPVAVAGYNVEATLDDHTITVTYTEKPVPTAPWSITFDNTNNAECIVIDNNNDGSKWQWDVYNNRFQYTYNGSNAADDYLVLPAIKLEAGKNYNISVNCGAQYTSEKLEIVCGTAPTVADLNTTVISEQTLPNGSKTLTKDGFTIATDGNYYFAFHVTSPADKWYAYAYGFSIDVMEPEAAPEFPVEGVAYEIKNIGLGKYINISSAETDAATVSDESEGLYFTWDEMKAAFTIQDADGNYLGKTTNDWTTSATTPEYWIVETVSDGVYAFKSVSSKYLAPNKNDGTDNRLMRDKDSNFYYTFTIAPFVVIPDAELTVTDAEWTTFCSHTNVMLPADYTAYIVTGTQENGQLELKALEGSFESKDVDYDFANNMVSMDGDNFVVEGAPDALTATFHTDGWAGGIQGGFLFGMSSDGDYVEISVPEDYEGNITYVEVEPYPGQSVTWKFDNGNFGSTARYTVNGKSVKVTIGGSYYYYIQHIRVGVEGLAAPVIPSYAGVLVNGPAGTNIPYTKVPSATPSDVTGNLLVGCNESATWSEAGKSYYKFSLNAANEAGSEGFYWGVDGGASIEAHAGKAYLVLDTPAASNSRYLINGFGDETLTGLDSVIAPEAAEAIFNLQGQRVGATKGGVYVKGGKKFIVK